MNTLLIWVFVTAPAFFTIGFITGYHYKEWIEKNVPDKLHRLLHH